MQDLVAGRLDFVAEQISTAVGHVNSGTIRGAVTGLQGYSALVVNTGTIAGGINGIFLAQAIASGCRGRCRVIAGSGGQALDTASARL